MPTALEFWLTLRTANTWKEDHTYRHSSNGIMAFLLFLFIAVNIFNIFWAGNIKGNKIKTKLSLIKQIKGGFLRLSLPLPPIPIHI